MGVAFPVCLRSTLLFFIVAALTIPLCAQRLPRPSPLPGTAPCSIENEASNAFADGALPPSERPSANIDFAGRALFGYGTLNSWGFPVAVDPLLKRAYVGFRSSLAVLSVVDKVHPALLGWMDTDGQQITSVLVPFPGASTIWMGTRGGRVGTVNVFTPAAPSWLTFTAMDARGMALTTTSLLVASGSNFVLLDRATLSVQSTTPLGTAAYGVAALGNLAYVAADSGLFILDISVPSAPILLSSTSSASARAVAVQDRSGTVYAFLANNSGSPDLSIFDVTLPGMPAALAAVDLSTGGGMGLALQGTYLFLAGTSGGLQVVDVTSPASPALVTSYSAAQAYGVILDSTAVYVHGRRDGLVVLDASGLPGPLSLYGDFPTPGAWGVDVQGRYGYFGNGLGLFAADLSTLARPRVVSRLSGMAANDIQISGTTAYIADPGGFLRVVDLSTPSSPLLTASYPVSGTPVAVAVRGGYALLACDSGGLVVVRLSDGALFTLATAYWAWDIEIAGDLACVATYYTDYSNPSVGEALVVDISNPEAPLLLGTAVTQNGVNGLSVLGAYLYAATDWGLEIFDISFPSAPYFVGGAPASSGAFGVSVANGLAYLGTYDELQVLDVTSPWSPAEVANYPTEPWAARPLYRDGYCYVAGAIGGAYVLHAVNACYDRYEPNDDFEHAWGIATGTYSDALICRTGDADYYALTLPSGGTLTATLTPPAGLNYDLFLYDAWRTLAASSTLGAGAVETLSYTATAAGSYTLLVNGADPTQFNNSQNYRLVTAFSPCAGPVHPLLIYSARLDPNGDVILDILDPNQAAAVTGYNIYRAGAPNGPWTLRAGNVVDMDQGTANAQYIDAGSNAGGPYYYLVTAVNASCGAEGP